MEVFALKVHTNTLQKGPSLKLHMWIGVKRGIVNILDYNTQFKKPSKMKEKLLQSRI